MKGLAMRKRQKKGFAEAIGNLNQSELRREAVGDRQCPIGGNDPAQNLPMQIGDEEQGRRQKGQQGGDARQRLAVVDRRPERIGEADFLGNGGSQRFERRQRKSGP